MCSWGGPLATTACAVSVQLLCRNRRSSGWPLSRVEHERREAAVVLGYCSQGLPPYTEKSCCLGEVVQSRQWRPLRSLFQRVRVDRTHHITELWGSHVKIILLELHISLKIRSRDFHSLSVHTRQPQCEVQSILNTWRVHVGAFSLEPITSVGLSPRASILPDNSCHCTRWWPHSCSGPR